MFESVIRNHRCPRCNSTLFVSRDPLDERGTVYCMAGHTFVPPRRPANRVGRRVQRQKVA